MLLTTNTAHVSFILQLQTPVNIFLKHTHTNTRASACQASRSTFTATAAQPTLLDLEVKVSFHGQMPPSVSPETGPWASTTACHFDAEEPRDPIVAGTGETGLFMAKPVGWVGGESETLAQHSPSPGTVTQ